MFRKFRNLDKIADLEKRVEEYQATIGILVQQRQNRDAVIEDLEEQRERHFEDTDLAKVKIWDLEKEVKELKAENDALKEELEATKIDLAEWKEIAQAKENK